VIQSVRVAVPVAVFLSFIHHTVLCKNTSTSTGWTTDGAIVKTHDTSKDFDFKYFVLESVRQEDQEEEEAHSSKSMIVGYACSQICLATKALSTIDKSNHDTAVFMTFSSVSRSCSIVPYVSSSSGRATVGGSGSMQARSLPHVLCIKLRPPPHKFVYPSATTSESFQNCDHRRINLSIQARPRPKVFKTATSAA
jgi:hypothetical protein